MSLITAELTKPPAFLPSLSASNTTFSLPESWGMNLDIVFNGISHPKPLEWQSWEGKELVNTGSFLDAPGLPILNLLSEADLALLPSELLNLIENLNWLAYELLQAALASQASYELAKDGSGLGKNQLHKYQNWCEVHYPDATKYYLLLDSFEKEHEAPDCWVQLNDDWLVQGMQNLLNRDQLPYYIEQQFKDLLNYVFADWSENHDPAYKQKSDLL